MKGTTMPTQEEEGRALLMATMKDYLSFDASEPTKYINHMLYTINRYYIWHFKVVGTIDFTAIEVLNTI